MNTATPRILLVEDDESLRSMYYTILTKEGFSVELAGDGVDGLGKARAGGYDLVLLDLMMPNLNGIGLLRLLKEEGPKIPLGPIIVLSNAGYDAVAKEAESLGAAGFLMKADLLPKDLVREIRGYLDRDRTGLQTKAKTTWTRGRPAA